MASIPGLEDQVRGPTRDIISGISSTVNGERNTPFSNQPTSDSPYSPLPEDKIEPIAIIGMATKFPGDATTPENFWQMLIEGRSAKTVVPLDRYDARGFRILPGAPHDQLSANGGHFVMDDVAAFDAPFFNITAAEAADMDPMQRWLLEVSFHALEDAGLPMENVTGSQTSVFVGSFTRDYDTLLSRDGLTNRRYRAIGTSNSILANRLSWYYNLTGPSVQLDTACSSSLTAFHLACQSLRSRDSSMALVAGCNLWLDPDSANPMADAGIMSPDSACYSFDHRANGYGRGEGLGVVILKPLKLALQDGDTVRAVVRATGVNQNGRSAVMTQPSRSAQENLIRDTYRAGGLDLSITTFVEAHGTGTRIGDPTEAAAIGSVFNVPTRDRPVIIGAVKPNIGHLEGAAGVAGIIKTVLVLEKGLIPPNINFERLNPGIDSDALNIKFPTSPIPWPTNDLRRASVNSFGFGGANAHVVLDDAYSYLKLRGLRGNCKQASPSRSIPSPRATAVSSPDTANSTLDGVVINVNGCDVAATSDPMPKLFILSAAESDGLKRICGTLLAHIQAATTFELERSFLADLAWTLSEKRSHLPWKAFLVANSISELKSARVCSPPQGIRSHRVPNIAFVLTGQGAQWFGMGRDLFAYPVFKRSIEQADKILRHLGSLWSLSNILLRQDYEHTNLDDPVYSQPLCTALQLGLVDLLHSWGVTPKSVVGHSSGEIAAAYCAGGLDRMSALKVAYFRGVVAASLKDAGTPSGSMLAVGTSQAAIMPYLHRVDPSARKIAVACFNSPTSVTVSGEAALIVQLKEHLDHSKIFNRKLLVNVAYHSGQMEAVAPTYRSLLGNLCRRNVSSSDPKMISSITGSEVSPEELCNSSYWIRNLVSPVRFHAALQTVGLKLPPSEQLVQMDDRAPEIHHFLEIGPHSALQVPINDYLTHTSQRKDLTYSSLLKRDQSALKTTMSALGHLHCLGYPIPIACVNDESEPTLRHRAVPNLPGYPFNHSKKYWSEGRISKSYRSRSVPYLEFLGSRVADWNPLHARWHNLLKQSEGGWINDHKINGTTIYPAAGMLVMAIEAVRQLVKPGMLSQAYSFRNVTIHEALVIPPGDVGVEVHVHLVCSGDINSLVPSWNEFRIYAYREQEWSMHCQGDITTETYNSGSATSDLSEAQRAQKIYRDGADNCIAECESSSLYKFLHEHGTTFGPHFQQLSQIRFNNHGEAIASTKLEAYKSEVSSQEDQRPYFMHPVVLDALFQTIYPALSQGGHKSIPSIAPTLIRSLSIFGSNGSDTLRTCGTARTLSKIKPKGLRNFDMSLVSMYGETGNVCAIGDIEITAITNTKSSDPGDLSHEALNCFVDWKPDLDLLSNACISSYCCPAVSRKGTSVDGLAEVKALMAYTTLRKIYGSRSSLKLAKDKPQFARYMEWAGHKITEPVQQSFEQHLNDVWESSKNTLNIDEISKQLDCSDAEGKLLLRVAQNLSSILLGDTDALEVLFDDDGMTEYYQESHNTPGFMGALSYLDTHAHKHPNVKILELGAGTGGATRQILETLTVGDNPRLARYVFTDISPEFFESARARFGYLRNRIDFAKLDIESDPTIQGFEAHSFDVVVASNVLHATKYLPKTLENTWKLLKPGGKLMLIEVTDPEALIPGFVFGLLPGWWLGTEQHRKWGPLLTRGQWNTYMFENGFSSGIDFVMPSHGDSTISCMIATASVSCGSYTIETASGIESGGVQSHSIVSRKVHLITDDVSIPQSEMASRLADRLHSANSFECKVARLSTVKSLDTGEGICVFLPDIERPFLSQISPEEYAACKQIVTSKQLLWVSKRKDKGSEPLQALATGFARSLRSETPDMHLVSLELQPGQDVMSMVEQTAKVLEVILTTNDDNLETEIREIDGHLCINRLTPAKHLNLYLEQKLKQPEPAPGKLSLQRSRKLKLTMKTPGLLDTLHFSDSGVADMIPADSLEVEVKAAGLNFRDVLIALGHPVGNHFGMECSGIVKHVGFNCDFSLGDRVSCCVEGALATVVRCEAYSAVKIPDDMTFATAAAYPVVFLTAYHAIIQAARMQRGESILIHSAAGGFGQACIQTAKLFDASIFATVRSADKRDLLRNTYGLQDDHIFSSTSSNFASDIQHLTNGYGVDIIINSRTGEALRKSWDCIAPFGRFVEVGKMDLSSSNGLPMGPFARGASFIGLDLFHFRQIHPQSFHELMEAAMKLFVEGKYATPRPLTVFKASQIESAFRHLASGTSKGKIAISFEDVEGDDEDVQIVPSMVPSWEFDEQSSYVLAGGLGGLGRSFSRWMVSRNAKHLIIISRQNPPAAEAQELLHDLRMKGVNVAMLACDVGDRDSLALALASCSHMPPIKGCIQGAMVLRDGLFPDMTIEDFKAPLNPKVQGSWNLHSLLPSGMDFFIALSSVSGIVGLAGQANYASGNTYQDALMQYRFANGEKAISLDLCHIQGVGFVAERSNIIQSQITDFSSITEYELLALLEYYCDPSLIISRIEECQIVVRLHTPQSLQAQSPTLQLPAYFHRPLWRNLLHTSTQSHNNESAVRATVKELLGSASNIEEATQVLIDGIVGKLSRTLSIPKEDIDARQPITAYGVDSLSAVELRAWFRKEAGVELSVFEILGRESIADLGRKISGRSQHIASILEDHAAEQT